MGVFVALASMGLSGLTVFILNMFYFRPRPFVDLDVNLLFYRPTDSSFPANSAAAAFGIAFGIWSVNRRLGGFAIAVAGLYGLARVYAGVHYPLDILGGSGYRDGDDLRGAQAERSGEADSDSDNQGRAGAAAGLIHLVIRNRAADVEAEVCAAYEVDVGVELGLEGVASEVGDYPVAFGTHFLA